MAEETTNVRILIDTNTVKLLKLAAGRKGVSVEQYCSDAVHSQLSQEEPVRKFSAKGMIEAGEAIFQGKLSVTDSAELIREAREERHRNL